MAVVQRASSAWCISERQTNASKVWEAAILLCSYHLHIDAIIFAVALWWSGNHSAASFVGEKMIRGCARAQRHCPTNRYQ